MKYKGIDLQGLDPSIEVDAAKGFIEYRWINGKKLTQRAFGQAMKKSLEAFKIHMTPAELIDLTVEKGWSGINADWAVNAKNNDMMVLQKVRGRPQQNLDAWINTIDD